MGGECSTARKDTAQLPVVYGSAAETDSQTRCYFR